MPYSNTILNWNYTENGYVLKAVYNSFNFAEFPRIHNKISLIELSNATNHHEVQDSPC